MALYANIQKSAREVPTSPSVGCAFLDEIARRSEASTVGSPADCVLESRR